MNAGSLHTGETYAWKRNPRKGMIPIDAVKVRLRHIEQLKLSYETNRRTYAAITVVDTGQEYTVPAREIIMFWDEYEGEQAELLRERRNQQIAQRRVTLRHSVIEAAVNSRLIEREIPLVMNHTYSSTLSAPVSAVLSWLDISEADIQRAIDSGIAAEFPDDEET